VPTFYAHGSNGKEHSLCPATTETAYLDFTPTSHGKQASAAPGTWSSQHGAFGIATYDTDTESWISCLPRFRTIFVTRSSTYYCATTHRKTLQHNSQAHEVPVIQGGGGGETVQTGLIANNNSATPTLSRTSFRGIRIRQLNWASCGRCVTGQQHNDDCYDIVSVRPTNTTYQKFLVPQHKGNVSHEHRPGILHWRGHSASTGRSGGMGVNSGGLRIKMVARSLFRRKRDQEMYSAFSQHAHDLTILRTWSGRIGIGPTNAV